MVTLGVLRELDRALLDLVQSVNSPLLNLFACLSAGGLFGCGLATYRYAGRRTIRTPEDVEEELGLPLLAVLPRRR